MFTPKRISPDCPFKSKRSQVKISIFTLLCAVCLCGMLHTAEIVSAVCYTPPRLTLRWVTHFGDFFPNLVPLTPRYVAHHQHRLHGVHRDHLCGMLHTAEAISALGCTPWRFFQNF